jgi:hypothetical protein
MNGVTKNGQNMKRTKESYQKNKSPDLQLLEGKFLRVNKVILEHYGPNISVYLCNLIEKWKYFSRRKMLKDNVWFFLITDQQIRDTGMSKLQLQTCKRRLVKDEIISTIQKGYPRKELFKINWNTLFSIFRSVTDRMTITAVDDLKEGYRPNDETMENRSTPPLGRKSIEWKTDRLFNENKIKRKKINKKNLVSDDPPDHSPKKKKNNPYYNDNDEDFDNLPPEDDMKVKQLEEEFENIHPEEKDPEDRLWDNETKTNRYRQ